MKNENDLSDYITKKSLDEGYTCQHKNIMSIYGDFRPLAVSAGLGEWGRNGIVINSDYAYRCIPHAIKGCGECLKVCTKK